MIQQTDGAVKDTGDLPLTPEFGFSGGKSSILPGHTRRKICLCCTVSLSAWSWI